MLGRVIKRMIERGNTDGLAEKLDVFMAAGKISIEKYEELKEMLEK